MYIEQFTERSTGVIHSSLDKHLCTTHPRSGLGEPSSSHNITSHTTQEPANGEDVHNEKYPSALPFLPPLSDKTLKTYYTVYAGTVALIILFGGLLAPIAEVRLGLGGMCAVVVVVCVVWWWWWYWWWWYWWWWYWWWWLLLVCVLCIAFMFVDRVYTISILSTLSLTLNHSSYSQPPRYQLRRFHTFHASSRAVGRRGPHSGIILWWGSGCVVCIAGGGSKQRRCSIQATLHLL